MSSLLYGFLFVMNYILVYANSEITDAFKYIIAEYVGLCIYLTEGVEL